MQQMQLMLPHGVLPGQQIQVQTAGGLMQITVPPGAVGGTSLVINVPTAPPVAQAMAVAQPVPPQPVMAAQPLPGPQTVAPQPVQPPCGNMYPTTSHSPAMPTAPQSAAHMTQPLLSAESPTPVAMGQPVSAVMPNLPPPGVDQYSSFASYSTEHPEEAGRHHTHQHAEHADATASLPMGTPVAFFTDEQIAVLNQQPAPVDYFSKSHVRAGVPPVGEVANAGLPVAQSAAVAVAHPVLSTASGFRVLDTTVAGVSGAKTAYDGWSGLKSCDGRLQSNVDELLLFFNTHNSRPLVGCRIHGWHNETRHRRRRVEGRDGKHHWETETYIERVTDFDYKVDLTQFIYPYGYITSVDENRLSVPELMHKYVNDANLLKSVAMKKEVQFDFNTLHAMVYGYLRSLGWRRGLTISFPKANHSVRVYNENWLSNMWENACINCLCHITIVPCILMRIYRGDCCGQEDHAEEDVRSFFRINYAAVQVFEAIRPALWCPGFSGAAFAMELLRDVFW